MNHALKKRKTTFLFYHLKKKRLKNKTNLRKEMINLDDLKFNT